jgi:hypothetical protein
MTDAKFWGFAMLITGSHFSQQEILMAFLDIAIPSKTAVYQAQPEICEVPFSAATEFSRKWAAGI